MADITLYGYWRSSAAYRVRIALNLKKLTYKPVPIHLVKSGGVQHSPEFSALNPSELIPVLADGELCINQSLTIIEYLDDVYPDIRLIPESGKEKYLVKSLAQDITIDIHPLNNLRVLQYLTAELGVSESQKSDWYRHWFQTGFHGLEKKLAQVAGTHCVGDQISLVDVCLVPQVYNAERFSLDISQFPNIERITANLRAHPAFIAAEPESQPDAEI
ncbi:maleylacetoacetate isomerase [Vibrio aestuarianus]|uniref:maleylacetoacetate isomerase n=1 Tax=Vibrio aestuarianus TaxID=28171 RepID=UPI00237C5BBE|nr:maleylacetoacetate isomerase [Vibrio aestuarianus]MDE1317992.1 maleylacetoacetate isomerase [Vibrio aestuarianus]